MCGNLNNFVDVHQNQCFSKIYEYEFVSMSSFNSWSISYNFLIKKFVNEICKINTSHTEPIFLKFGQDN